MTKNPPAHFSGRRTVGRRVKPDRWQLTAYIIFQGMNPTETAAFSAKQLRIGRSVKVDVFGQRHLFFGSEQGLPALSKDSCTAVSRGHTATPLRASIII